MRWLAGQHPDEDQQADGTLANIAVGIVGAWLGGVLAGMLGFAAVTTLSSLIVAVLGACALIAILKVLNVFK